jgi:pimeloyl-ACP methyl ester carboxylesterase
MLEILHKKAEGSPKGNIVLVHGAWMGAWCWEDNFLPYFAQQGYNVYALSLRGHGNSPANKGLNSLSIGNYVTDVWQVVQNLTGNTYLIGHSMGGYIVQKFLEHYGASVTKAVLVASVPCNGVSIRPLKIVKAIGFVDFIKMNLLLDLSLATNTPKKVKAVCFNANESDELVQFTTKNASSESFTAYLQMLWGWFIKPKRIKTPLLIVSGGTDWLFPLNEQQVLVDTYQAPQLIYPDKPHNLFATEGWEQVAADIEVFLRD